MRSRGEDKREKEADGRKARRYVVETCFSWLNRFRKLLVRYEKTNESASPWSVSHAQSSLGEMRLLFTDKPLMFRRGTGSIINVSMNYETMKRRGFSPYGPSKAALESETIIWAQDLEGTGITVNEVLPGGATATGMIPPGIPQELRDRLPSPEIVVPPAAFLASDEGRWLTGRRLVATEWSPDHPEGRPAASGIGR